MILEAIGSMNLPKWLKTYQLLLNGFPLNPRSLDQPVNLQINMVNKHTCMFMALKGNRNPRSAFTSVRNEVAIFLIFHVEAYLEFFVTSTSMDMFHCQALLTQSEGDLEAKSFLITTTSPLQEALQWHLLVSSHPQGNY